MNESDLFINAYKKMCLLLARNPREPFLPWDDRLSERETGSATNPFYVLQEQTFRLGLWSSIQEFANELHRLAIWDEVISEYQKNDADELRLGFTRLPVKFCLSEPYAFKSKIVFAATKLCYIKGLFDNLIKEEDITKDHDIKYESLQKAVTFWKTGGHLCKTIEAINDAEFHKNTGNYRNRN